MYTRSTIFSIRKMATAMMHCAACNSSHPNYICGGCRRVAYCDVACQSKDWKSVHRWNCPAGAVGDDIDSDLDAESGGAINDFGLSVLATMDKNVREKGSPQCVLISPLSISIALAMLAEGAIGKTRDEIVRWIDPDGEISKIGLDTLMPKVRCFAKIS